MSDLKKPSLTHYIIAAQSMISSILLEEDFTEHLKIYRSVGSEAIEDYLGELTLTYSVEMELVQELADVLSDENVCEHCVLASCMEINDHYVRRRYFRISEYLIENMSELKNNAKLLVNKESVDFFYEDKKYREEFLSDQEFFNGEEEIWDLIDKKEDEKLLN